MGRKQIAALLLTFLIASCSGKKYLAPNFETIAAAHKVIAILPFTVKYTGNLPPFFAFKDIEFVSKKEGQAFQQSFYNQLGSLKNSIIVQPPITTREKLKNLDTKGTSLSYADYCKALGVNAVISVNISKLKLFTNLDSLGIYFPRDIKEKLKLGKTDLNDNLPQIPGNAERTYILKSEISITDDKNTLLWKYADNLETNWSADGVETINRLTQQLQNDFPYSIKTVN